MSSDLNLDIYVISLPDAHDRRERVQREFSKLGLALSSFSPDDSEPSDEEPESDEDEDAPEL